MLLDILGINLILLNTSHTVVGNCGQVILTLFFKVTAENF